jgi:hypothetical protein
VESITRKKYAAGDGTVGRTSVGSSPADCQCRDLIGGGLAQGHGHAGVVPPVRPCTVAHCSEGVEWWIGQRGATPRQRGYLGS